MNYIFALDLFEGPLDLLLHLIKEDNIDICDIEIAKVTGQYLEYIHKNLELNLNVASEYLVIAAELIEMKSHILLPIHESEEEMIEEDPREQLIKRLIEYKNYKEVTPHFKELEEVRRDYFTKDPSMIPDEMDIAPKVPEDLTMNTLLEAFKNFMERKQLDKPLQTKVTGREYSVTKRSSEIKNILKQKGEIYFNDLFNVMEKDYIIVTFLAILNLAKNGELTILQDNNFDSICLCERGVAS